MRDPVSVDRNMWSVIAHRDGWVAIIASVSRIKIATQGARQATPYVHRLRGAPVRRPSIATLGEIAARPRSVAGRGASWKADSRGDGAHRTRSLEAPPPMAPS